MTDFAMYAAKWFLTFAVLYGMGILCSGCSHLELRHTSPAHVTVPTARQI